jgi:hypothetical protein
MEKSRQAVIVAVFALMAAGALVPAVFFNTRPEKLVLTALHKLDGDVSFMGAATIGTFVPASAITAAGGDPKAQPVPIVFVGEGGLNLPKDKPPSGRAAFVMVGQGKAGKDLSLDVSATQDGKAYAKLSNLPESEKSAVLVKFIDDKWFSMDARTLASLIARDPQKPAADANNPTGTRPAATWQTLRKELVTPGFFGTPIPMALTEMTTVPVKHFALPIHADKLVTFSQDLKSLLLGRSLSADELQQVADDTAKRDIALEIWVYTQRQELAQLKLTSTSRNAGNADDNADANHFSMVLKFTSWGSPVEVAAPDAFTPYSDIASAFKKPTK